jgi:hypothetical protein
MPAKNSAAEKMPHSWTIDGWPSNVYPCTPSRARYIVRAHRDELIAARALSRVGRDLVVLGEGYGRWLAKRTAKVEGFDIAPNAARRASQAVAAEAEAA